MTSDTVAIRTGRPATTVSRDHTSARNREPSLRTCSTPVVFQKPWGMLASTRSASARPSGGRIRSAGKPTNSSGVYPYCRSAASFTATMSQVAWSIIKTGRATPS